MPTDKMLARKDGAIGAMIFNNPERRNAVSLEMWEAAREILEDFARDAAIRVVTVSGAGGKAFVSGADISRFEQDRSTPETVANYNAVTDRARDALLNLAKPTIAMIQGWCVGGGMAVALNCDLRVCSDDARFGIPAAKLGLGYGFKSLKSLADVVGPAVTKEMLFTGRNYAAQDALRMGLVNQVVPAAELEATVKELAETIAANAPLTVLGVKRIVGEILKDAERRDPALCEKAVADCFASQDYVEGRRAFMEKRKPVFQGR